jgi:hypothetical protein
MTSNGTGLTVYEMSITHGERGRNRLMAKGLAENAFILEKPGNSRAGRSKKSRAIQQKEKHTLVTQIT